DRRRRLRLPPTQERDQSVVGQSKQTRLPHLGQLPISSAECATQRTAYSRHSTAKERGAVEIHTGQFPPEFADLACFIAVALVADAKRLCGVAGRSRCNRLLPRASSLRPAPDLENRHRGQPRSRVRIPPPPLRTARI